MKKLKPPKGVSIAILTLITIIFWAGFEVYHSLTAKPTHVVATDVINPIDPTLDTQSLDSLNQRLYFTDDQIRNNTASSIPVATTAPSASPSATVTPTATPGGPSPTP